MTVLAEVLEFNRIVCYAGFHLDLDEPVKKPKKKNKGMSILNPTKKRRKGRGAKLIS